MPGVGRAAGERSARDGREARIDPICHTLVGAALSRGGLGRRTGLGATALIVGANFPDMDVLAYFAGPAADLEWRRGWSHGVLAIAVLPFVLTGLLLLLHRWSRRRASWSARPTVVPKELLLLSFIAILSHPVLDALNTYGVRWLMPFSGKWFYGDILFIVDPWVWLVLALGIYSSRRRIAPDGKTGHPVRLALAVIALYVGGMALAGIAAARIVASEVSSLFGSPVQATMAGPVPLNPLIRKFVTEQEGVYRVGTFRWLERPHVNPADVLTFARGRPSHPAVSRAAESVIGRRFLGWARFPTFEIEQAGPAQYLVHIVDLRYARRPGDRFGAISIPVVLPAVRR